jgi:uncharacterized protein (TIGR02466 family)
MTDLSQHTRMLELFPSAVQISNHPEPTRLNQELEATIRQLQAATPNSRPEDWACTVYTTIENQNEIHLHPAFEEISDFITQETHNFASENGVFLPSNKVTIKNMWVNIYNKNCSMDVHNHPNSLFSGIYFVKSPKDSAKLVFDSPSSERMISVPVLKGNVYNQENAACEPIGGDLFIFNSNLKHRALLHKLDEERISISFTAII